ncbi:enoyl-CoA hydratase/isomerase family protein [Halomonadaceae bacterium KBTZ08]
MSDQPVVFDEWPLPGDDCIGVARLNSPRSHNALSLEMIHQLGPRLQQWAEDPRVRAFWLEAEGEKAFCAGGDIVSMYQSMTGAGDVGEGQRFFTEEYQLDYQIHTFPKPIICWGNGIVMGGGIGLMMGASHRVVTEQSKLGMPEVNIGLYPDIGAGWFLSRMPGHTGLFLGLTGAVINGPDALFTGMADRFIRQDLKQEVADALTRAPWHERPDHAVVGGVLRRFEQHSTEVMPESAVRTHFDAINRAVDADTLEAVVGQLMELSSRDDWLGKATKGLANASPTSMALMWRHYHRSRLDSLAQVLETEKVMSHNCVRKGEFAEGVRALLIDKDHQPRWHYATLAEMDSDWIDDFFN